MPCFTLSEMGLSSRYVRQSAAQRPGSRTSVRGGSLGEPAARYSTSSRHAQKSSSPGCSPSAKRDWSSALRRLRRVAAAVPGGSL